MVNITMKADRERPISAAFDEKNRSSTEWTSSIIDDSEGRSSSSTLSWTDEADCSVAEQLKLRYEQFEAALYSEAPSDILTASERTEKEIWNEYTPHLRVTGKKIHLASRALSSEDVGESSMVEEIIAQHPELPANRGRRTASLTRGDGAASCRSMSSRSRSKEGGVPTEDALAADRLTKEAAERLLEPACPNGKRVGLIPKNRKASSPRNSLHLTFPDDRDNAVKENTQLNAVQTTRCSAVFDVSLLPFRDQGRAKSSHFDSSGKVETRSFRIINRNGRNPSSARRLRKRSEKEEHETESMSDRSLESPTLSVRHGFLPPIESLTITPKLPSKRANSAMLRFTKTQSRSRPTTSRSKSIFVAPIESFSVINAVSKFTITPIQENIPSVFGTSLPICTSRRTSKRSKMPPRWRY